jgi:hypothetical protein
MCSSVSAAVTCTNPCTKPGDFALARPQGLSDSGLPGIYTAFDDALAWIDTQINLQLAKPMGHALHCLDPSVSWAAQ